MAKRGARELAAQAQQDAEFERRARAARKYREGDLSVKDLRRAEVPEITRVVRGSEIEERFPAEGAPGASAPTGTVKEASPANGDAGADRYRELRESIGSQVAVADLLGVTRETVGSRERGLVKITAEHLLALEALIGRGK